MDIVSPDHSSCQSSWWKVRLCPLAPQLHWETMSLSSSMVNLGVIPFLSIRSVATSTATLMLSFPAFFPNCRKARTCMYGVNTVSSKQCKMHPNNMELYIHEHVNCVKLCSNLVVAFELLGQFNEVAGNLEPILRSNCPGVKWHLIGDGFTLVLKLVQLGSESCNCFPHLLLGSSHQLRHLHTY